MTEDCGREGVRQVVREDAASVVVAAALKFFAVAVAVTERLILRLKAVEQ